MAADGDLKLTESKWGLKKIIILASAVVVVLIVAAGAYFYFLGGKSSESADGIEAAANQASGENRPTGPEGNALYVAMPRPFVFNVPGSARDRLVQIKVQLLVRGSNNETVAQRHIPLIEASLLESFASADEMVTTTGKDALKNKALSDLQQALLEVAGTVVVEEVLFTSFVMQ